LDDTGNLCFKGWRCLLCGEILDPVIANNRGSHPMPLLGRARKKFAAQVNWPRSWREGRGQHACQETARRCVRRPPN